MPDNNRGRYEGRTPTTEETQASLVNRPLPQNIDAEKSVLAACLLDADAMEEVASRLKPENFFRGQHKIIFESMLDLTNRRIPVDQISVAENLRGKDLLERVGGKGYLLELADNTFAVTNWRNHAEIVKRTSIMRDLVHASVKIGAMAYDAEDDMLKVVGEAEQTLFSVTEQGVASDFRKMDDMLSEVYRTIEERSKNKGRLIGVPTGFTDVDKLFNGFREGDLVILAARPSVGKTAFALNMAVNAAKAGCKVAFLSLEMSNSQLVMRMLCSEARVSMQKVNAGTVADSDWSALVEASARLANLNLYIDDTPGLSIQQLRTKATRLMHDAEPNRGIVFVDYLQLMQPNIARRDGNRAVEVSEISRGLKILAKDLKMPVVALSQLSRDIEKRSKSDKAPKLSDLRESGSIEQDADIVMFLDRSLTQEEADSDDRPGLNEARLIVAKHRNGPIGTIDLEFKPEFTRFGDSVNLDRYGADLQ